jgi:peptidoglycan/xylan/chitin deacetylase (PgdA/CDA1 family)
MVASSRPEWPDGKRCAVMLCVEVDGPASWIARDERVWDWPKTFSLGAYGPWRGLPRALGLLEELDFPATFFVPGWIAEQWPDRVGTIAAAGHELAHHGYLHERYTGASWDEHSEWIIRSQAAFEQVGGRPAVGFRPPYGDPHPDHVRLLQRHGFKYRSASSGDDRPYRVVIDGVRSELIEIPHHFELDDLPQFAFNFYPPVPIGQDRIAPTSTTLDIWRREFHGYYRFGLCFVLTVHPQLIAKPGRIRMLASLLQEIRSTPDVWIARGGEIADWCQQKLPKASVGSDSKGRDDVSMRSG